LLEGFALQTGNYATGMPSKDCNAGMHLCPTEGGSKPKAGCRRLHFLSPDRVGFLCRAQASPRHGAAPHDIRSDQQNRRRLGSGRRRARITRVVEEQRTAAARPARPARTAAAIERAEVVRQARVSAATPPAPGARALASSWPREELHGH